MAQTVAFCAPISVCAVLSTTLSLIVKPADQLSISAHTHTHTHTHTQTHAERDTQLRLNSDTGQQR